MTTRHLVADPSGVDVGEGQELFVYAVVPAGRAIPDGVVGLDEAPVDTIGHGQVAAVVSAFDVDRPPGRRADLMAYNTVVGQLAEDDVVAPIRFGTVLPDGAAVVEDLLAPREAALADLLERLAGRHQFNLRATYVEETVLREIVETDPTVRELTERTRDLPEEAAYGERVQLGELVARAYELRSEADAADLIATVAPRVEAIVDRGSGGSGVLDVALLVDDERAGTLEETLEDLAEAVHERIRLRLVGPLAPFDFVEDL